MGACPWNCAWPAIFLCDGTLVATDGDIIDAGTLMHAVPIAQTGPSAITNSSAAQSSRAEDDSFDFWDFLDIINPLQHIPIVSQIYRAITDDEISPTAKLVGDGLYSLGLLGGGWIGMASSAFDFAVEEATGDDIAGHLMDFVFGEDGESTALADGSEAGPGQGSINPEEAAVLAAVPRPPTVVVRSDPLSETPRSTMFAPPAAATGDPATMESNSLAATTGQVVSPAMAQALLLATQSDDPDLAEAAEEILSESTGGRERGGHAPTGFGGFSLDQATIQVGRGVVREGLSGLASAAAH